VKNANYKPPGAGLRPGRRQGVKVDRVEWIAMPDAQTQVAAIQNGEIDMIESPSHDLLPLLSKDKNIKLVNYNPAGLQYTFRFNSCSSRSTIQIRHAVMVGIRAGGVPQGNDRRSEWFSVCKAPLRLRTPLGPTVAWPRC